MARKAKAVVASAVELVAEIIEALPVAETEVEEVVEQSTGPSLMSQLVAQVVTAPVVEEVKAPTKEKNEGVGQFIRKLIAEGMTNKAILDVVHEQYGNKNTTYACVAWYRNKMNKAGAVKKVETSIEWLQNFAKQNGLSEESTSELGKVLKVA